MVDISELMQEKNGFGLAMRLFAKRYKTDTNAVIAQLFGKAMHIYFRSDQWIDQRLGIPDPLCLNLFQSEKPIPAYTGPAQLAPREFYGNGTFKVDIITMDLVRNYLNE